MVIVGFMTRKVLHEENDDHYLYCITRIFLERVDRWVKGISIIQ